MRTLAALAGFVALGLSPSFVDWQQSNVAERRRIVGYYVVALTLIYLGVVRGR